MSIHTRLDTRVRLKLGSLDTPLNVEGKQNRTRIEPRLILLNIKRCGSCNRISEGRVIAPVNGIAVEICSLYVTQSAVRFFAVYQSATRIANDRGSICPPSPRLVEHYFSPGSLNESQPRRRRFIRPRNKIKRDAEAGALAALVLDAIYKFHSDRRTLFPPSAGTDECKYLDEFRIPIISIVIVDDT